jgi:menaquinol-cytochrome c reductase iron-sulfur subunit
VEPPHGDDKPHLPPPSLWPVGFAVGIACILVGLVVNPIVIVPIGVAITLVFGFFWIREATAELRGGETGAETETVEVELPHAPPIPAHIGEAAMPEPDEGELARFPRSRFLEGATLGIGAVIGGVVTVPALGFAVLPAFTHQKSNDVDLGPIADFKEGDYVIATFLTDPSEGEVTRRTAYVRYNGLLDGEPSFTIISNRCAHLGCPVQPNGPAFDNQKRLEKSKNGSEVTLIPMLPAGFGCPCHGGQYDQEGNRTAGPPVRALDRYDFKVVDGRLVLAKTYSVAKVDGEGKDARIQRYALAGPGEHITGPEAWLYPIQPPSG